MLELLLAARCAVVGVPVESELSEANTTGDPALVERLVANLIANARQNNESHGWVRVWTGLRDGWPTVQITNPGPSSWPTGWQSCWSRSAA